MPPSGLDACLEIRSSDHSLNLILKVPGSTSRPHFQIANWFASSQLGFLTVVVVVVFFRFVHCVSLALKSPYGSGQLSMYYIVL